MKRLYFDYNATAPHASGLVSKINEWLTKGYKNPSSIHQEGQSARSLLEESRAQVKGFLKAKTTDNLVFTSGGTEANNVVLMTAFKNRGKKNKILLTGTEHVSVMNVARELEQKGVELIWLPLQTDGKVDFDQYESLLTNSVFLVSVMLANNETGFVLPVKEMAQRARKKGILFHTDAVCAVGKWPVDFHELGVDYLTFSGHKFGALMGAGGILSKPEVALSGLIKGGTQEENKRAGTQNLIGILSIAYALEISLNDLENEFTRQGSLRKTLKEGISRLYHNVIFTESSENLAQTLNVSFIGLDGKLFVTNLDLENVSVSAGSACSSGALSPSHVLEFIGCSQEVNEGAIRISFGSQTKKTDVDEFLSRLQKVIHTMKG